MKHGLSADSVKDMTSPRRRALALPASAVALATATLAAQAFIAAPAQSAAVHGSAGRTGGWRVDKRISVHDKAVILVSLDAVSAKDAWVGGLVASEYGATFAPLLEHWNGTAWRRVAPPPRLVHHFSRQDVLGFVGASSASNFWAFSLSGKYLRRVAGHWTFGRLPTSTAGRTLVGSVKVFSPTDVWVFGAKVIGAASNLKFAPFATRYNGHRWTVIRVPGQGPLGPVSVISPRNMWAIAGGEELLINGPPDSASIVHWNGVAWRKVAQQPKLPRQTVLAGILARTNTDVWVGGGIQGPQGSSEMAWHWNGSAWTSNSPHASANGQQYQFANFVPASGGMWALAENLGGAARLWRFSGGRWSAPIQLRWDLYQLAAVPHTKSIWAIGVNLAANTGLIVLHGPAPR